jgi:hypothetical protein
VGTGGTEKGCFLSEEKRTVRVRKAWRRGDKKNIKTNE